MGSPTVIRVLVTDGMLALLREGWSPPLEIMIVDA
jgi:hypothetical protein